MSRSISTRGPRRAGLACVAAILLGGCPRTSEFRLDAGAAAPDGGSALPDGGVAVDGGPEHADDAARPPIVDAGSGSRVHVVIDFDDIPFGELGDHYTDRIVFVARPGAEYEVYGFGCPSEPYCLAIHHDDEDHPYSTPFSVRFPRPADGLRFRAEVVNDEGPVARIRVFDGDELLETTQLIGDGNQGTTHDIDLSTHRHVTRVEIDEIVDYRGIAWDDFAFDVFE